MQKCNCWSCFIPLISLDYRAMISVIIPTYNEAESIGPLVKYLKKHSNKDVVEIIVTDGGSIDNTIAAAVAASAIAKVSPEKGRAAQMNYGASIAKGTVFYFIHADTFPPPTFVSDIVEAVRQKFNFGRYRTRFNSNKLILKLNAFFTRFDLFVCYGGDQTLFITRELFETLHGFDINMRIMEDYDLTARAKKTGRYKIIQKDALISARKYDTNTWWKVQKANYTIVQMFKKGATQEEMVERYKEMLDYR